MKARNLILIYSVALFACTQTRKAEEKTLDLGVFKLTTPYNWIAIKEKGIDSYVGALTNGTDTLWFDYGWYSPDVGNEDPKKHKMATDTVNGLPANIVIPIEDGKGDIAMNISGFDNKDNKFFIVGQNIKGTEAILKIFKSIRFKESDTSKNPPLTMQAFSYSPSGSGKQLFLMNCASCHNPFKDATGPALRNIKEHRTADWIFKFITNRKILGKDSINIELVNKYGMRCPEFPHLTKEEVQRIFN